MSKSKKFYYSTDAPHQHHVRRSTSDSNHSISRSPNTDETDHEKNKLQQHPPLMRKKSHFFQAHHRDAIDTTPTIEFSPSDDDDDCGGNNTARPNHLPANGCVRDGGPVIVEHDDESVKASENVGTSNQGETGGEVSKSDSASSLISKRELRKRMARLLLRSCNVFDVDNNLPGDRTKKYSLRWVGWIVYGNQNYDFNNKNNFLFKSARNMHHKLIISGIVTNSILTDHRLKKNKCLLFKFVPIIRYT